MKSHLGKILRLAHRQRRRYVGAVVALVCGSSFMYLVPLVPQAVIDGVLPDASLAEASATTRWILAAGGGRAFVRDHLWLPAVLIALLTTCAGAFTYLRARLSAQASESIVRSVRDRLYDHLQHLPVAYYDGAATGDLVQRCTSDVDTLRRFLANQVVEIGRALLMLALPIPLMLAKLMPPGAPVRVTVALADWSS